MAGFTGNRIAADMIDVSYWFMFPVGICVATIAMFIGIGGAIMFSPFFMLALNLEPVLAMGAGLTIEIFGFSSGVVGYSRTKSIRYDIVKKLIIFTLPATVIGVAIGRLVSGDILRGLLGALILYLAFHFLRRSMKKAQENPNGTIAVKHPQVDNVVRGINTFGGLLMGMISSGLGEVNQYNFLQRMGLPVRNSSGTSVFLVATSAFIGVCAHLYFLVSSGDIGVFSLVLSIIVFAVPGVIIGAQIGSRLSQRVNHQFMYRFVGSLFIILGIATFLTVGKSLVNF